jgi:hypothetical protein
MTIHYSVESLAPLFLSESYLDDKNKYKQKHKVSLSNLDLFLNSIEINKQYFRTGIQVKNPKYKRKVYDDTSIIKQLKLSLNKMSGLTYETLSKDICAQLDKKKHLYPILLQYIFEQSLLHHTYCPYYAYLVELLHTKFSNETLLLKQVENSYQEIIHSNHSSENDYSALCAKNKQIDQLIGYSIFIAELEVKQVIQNKVDQLINQLIQKLTLTNEDECYKCVLCLYNLCKVIYKDRPIKSEYEETLTEIKSTIKFMKVKFKIMDILERK